MQDALQRTFDEGQRLDAGSIGSEHVLLGVLAAENGTGVLTGLGVTPEAIRTYLRAESS